jgi:hypothetical protein
MNIGAGVIKWPLKQIQYSAASAVPRGRTSQCAGASRFRAREDGIAVLWRRCRGGEGVRMGSGGGGGGGVGSGRVLMTGGDRGCRQELSSGRDGGSWW